MKCRIDAAVPLLALLALTIPLGSSGRLLATITADWNNPNGDIINAFSPVFADYNAAAAEEGLIAKVETIPTVGTRGYHFVTSNRADDIYYGLKGRVQGLPNATRVRLEFDVTIASNVGEDCLGVGGSPGSSVWVKAGATSREPTTNFNGDTWRFVGLNKGEQSGSGPGGAVLGNVAVAGGTCDGSDTTTPYKLKSFTKRALANAKGKPYVFSTTTRGQLWLLVGFESGFEGISSLYITKIVARIYDA